jgi:hypothetical protein
MAELVRARTAEPAAAGSNHDLEEKWHSCKLAPVCPHLWAWDARFLMLKTCPFRWLWRYWPRTKDCDCGYAILRPHEQHKGLSTRVRIAVRIAGRFRARFLRKQNRESILFLLPIAMVCFHISAKNNQKVTCFTPLAANRPPNRMGIRMENRTCRLPLRGRLHVRFPCTISCARWFTIKFWTNFSDIC